MVWMTWVLSFVGLLTIFLLGRKNRWGFAAGLLADVLWFVYSMGTQQWGLVPACGIYAVVHVWGWKKWSRHLDTDPDGSYSTT